MHPPVTMRPAVEADLPAVLALYAAAGIDGPGETLTPQQAARLFATFQRYPNYTLQVAEAAGAIVGTFALLIMDNLGHGGAPSGIVEDVAVAPEMQAQGVGRVMMQHARQLCSDRGCYKLVLSSNAKRADAHAFYEHLGFERHGFSFLVPVAAEVAVTAAEATATGVMNAADTCDVCGGSVYELHCKLICRVCGFTRDCSDP